LTIVSLLFVAVCYVVLYRELSSEERHQSMFHANSAAIKMLIAVDFEVFGAVQGVFFRKYTQKQAKQLRLVGWVHNTRRDTVEGQMQGDKQAIEQMKTWLQKVGSPSSKIDRVEFRNEKEISGIEYSHFEVRH